MRKRIIKGIYLTLVFFVSLLVIGRLTNTESVDMTAELTEATLPTITLISGGREINMLHGYTDRMRPGTIRECILPVDTSRRISAVIDSYGARYSDLRFEVRPLNEESLIENTRISGLTGRGTHKRFNIQMKDLIETDREYMLIFLLETGNPARTVRYYCRVIQTSDDTRYHVDEQLRFVADFSEKTFHREEAGELTRYLESNASGDNSTFARVDIHSSFLQVTWGDLPIAEHTDPMLRVNDIHAQTASIENDYRIRIGRGDAARWYVVHEYYRARYTTERMYLLDFRREMAYLYAAAEQDYEYGTIHLSISDPDMTVVESSDGKYFAFACAGGLYAVDQAGGRISRLLSFTEGDVTDPRTTWNRHEMRVLQVGDTGNVIFAVAGYMNRGTHEGQVGICVYAYDAGLNTVEEQIFLRTDQAPEILLDSFEKLSYLSADGRFYTVEGSDVCAVDLDELNVTRVISGMVVSRTRSGEAYRISASGSTIAWQGEDPGVLQIMDLARGSSERIEAEEDEEIRLLDFMGEDLVYGLVRRSDILPDHTGNEIRAMYRIVIVNNAGSLLGSYEQEGLWVMGAQVDGAQIRLTRVRQNEAGTLYESAPEDQITNTVRQQQEESRVLAIATGSSGTTVEIRVTSNTAAGTLMLRTPNMTLYEGSREQVLGGSGQEASGLLYVYDYCGRASVYANVAEAVRAAYDAHGVVCDAGGAYIWYRGNLRSANQLMALTRSAESIPDMTTEDATALCLSLMLQQAALLGGTEEDTADQPEIPADPGLVPAAFLQEALPAWRILELDGCPMDAMLYYVDREIPVLVQLNDGTSLLMIGFNDLNTVIVDPARGFIGKLGRGDSQARFADSGNRFLTFLPR